MCGSFKCAGVKTCKLEQFYLEFFFFFKIENETFKLPTRVFMKVLRFYFSERK